MNKWAQEFFGKRIIDDWRQQLSFTTKIFRARGLHLDDRHVREADGTGCSLSAARSAEAPVTLSGSCWSFSRSVSTDERRLEPAAPRAVPLGQVQRQVKERGAAQGLT